MSAVARLALAIVLIGACHRAPDEPPSLRTDGGTATLARPTVHPPADAQAEAAGPIRDFCENVYSADSRNCSASDADKTRSLTHLAANLCARDLSAILAPARATFDGDAAARCVEMLRDKALARTSETDTLFSHFPCDRVLLGTQAAGGPCRYSAECKDGLACVVSGAGPDGVCSAPPAAGQPCSRQAIGSTVSEAGAAAHHPACAKGAWCDGRTCQSRLASGKGCSSDAACADGLGCIMGRCGQPRPIGGVCQAKSDCVFGLWCAPSADGGVSGICREKLGESSLCATADSCKGKCELDRGPDGGTLQHGKCVSVCGSG
jgi:hypothetical protein